MEKIKMKPWTDELKKKHVWLFNYIKIKYPDAELDTYIDKYKKYLMTLIEENPSWGDKSKESLLLMVSRFLHNNGNSRYSKIYPKSLSMPYSFDFFFQNSSVNRDVLRIIYQDNYLQNLCIKNHNLYLIICLD